MADPTTVPARDVRTATQPTLTRRPAPPFWTRWAVTGSDGAPLGQVDYGHRSRRWYAIRADWDVVGTWFDTQDAAVAALTEQEIRRG